MTTYYQIPAVPGVRANTGPLSARGIAREKQTRAADVSALALPPDPVFVFARERAAMERQLTYAQIHQELQSRLRAARERLKETQRELLRLLAPPASRSPQQDTYPWIAQLKEDEDEEATEKLPTPRPPKTTRPMLKIPPQQPDYLNWHIKSYVPPTSCHTIKQSLRDDLLIARYIHLEQFGMDVTLLRLHPWNATILQMLGYQDLPIQEDESLSENEIVCVSSRENEHVAQTSATTGGTR